MVDPVWFSPPVPVRDVKRVGLTRNVNSVLAALEQLNAWEKRGKKWHQAAEICAGAMVGGYTPAEAREAFEAAAKETGMLRGM